MAAKNLVIVESPAKIKSISKYLGKDFTVMASMGHVRDLPKSKMGIDVDGDFTPQYLVSKDKTKVIKGLKATIGPNTKVWVATDEDREGEAIGWHLLKALKLDENEERIQRIVFHEITKPAILHAVANPRKMNMPLVDAQQARRILDRLVGYSLSPILWKKIKYGLSAGRVQSVAVRLVVDRERQIQAFNPEEYWSVIAKLENGEKAKFDAKLNKYKGKKIKPGSEKETNKILKDLEGATYEVVKVEEKETKRNPSAPFITSTLQQEASRKLGFSVKKTMMLAQRLYEGIELSTGHEGLITYMRTDSVNLSDTALTQAKVVVTEMYGKAYALSTPRKFKGKKGAQEAHEAIRPTSLARTPEDLKSYLEKDQLRLYELIWKRTLACQMAHAVLDKVGIDIEANEYNFRATGQTIKFPGFMKLYMEGRDDEEDEKEDKEHLLPKMEKGDNPDLKEIIPTQHFTKPPARFTEATLVKKLEAEGIGRPSTFAPTISTIQTRGYIEKEAKQLRPTDIGMLVNDFLVEHFPTIMEYAFTVKMEEMLDQIAEGRESWKEEIKDFYTPFHAQVEDKMKSIKKEDVVKEETDEICEKCQKPMMVKYGRYGKFLSCTGFPECKNAKPMAGDEPPKPTEEQEKALEELKKKYADKKCPKCEKAMDLKTGRFGNYLACSDYPKCKSTESILKKIGVKCPKCNEGDLAERRTRKGAKLFFGCERFPKCQFAVWEKPDNSEHALELSKEKK
jgi:DNA topoisomerase-1